MIKHIYTFDELPPELQPQAGGKGGSLAKLYQSGYPVPAGFVILATAFEEDALLPEAWSQVRAQLEVLRAGKDQQAFAVRSSALSEELEVVNTSMEELLDSFLGPGILPPHPIICVNHYIYYNGSLKPASIARLLFDMVGIARRMFTSPVERWTEQGRPAYLAAIQKWQACSWRNLPNTHLLVASRELAHASIDAYLSMVAGLIPAAWINEAIYASDTLIGFVLLHTGSDDEDGIDCPGVFLWRFMIAGPHQGKRFGRQAMQRLLAHPKAQGIPKLYTSCGQDEASPEGFYRRLGFLPTGEMYGDEIELKLSIAE